MRVRWFGQSAFELRGETAAVVVDPFGDVSALAARGMTFDYPAIEGVPRVSFLEQPDAFLERMPHVVRLDDTAFDPAALPADEGAPLVVLPAVP